MSANPGTLWTLDELGRKAAEALAVDYEGPPNDRVRDVPDPRTIRYYTTLGLVDRPVQMRGRTAYYGLRHLLQLVAIKRLQAQGLSLAEVQRRLFGLADPPLAELARLPDGLATTDRRADHEVTPSPRAESFWKEAPAPPGVRAKEPAHPPTLQGIRLDDDATLLLAAARPIDEDDLQAIRKAAGPLLRLLERRGLIGPGPGRGDR